MSVRVKERRDIGVIGTGVLKRSDIEAKSRLSIYERLFTKERDVPGKRRGLCMCASVCRDSRSEGSKRFVSVQAYSLNSVGSIVLPPSVSRGAIVLSCL